MEELGKYIHLPFCKRRCPYCHFYVTTDQSQKREFLRALRMELELQAPLFEGKKVRSIYFGGGTPSQLTPAEIASITELPEGIEITLEANPEDCSEEYLRELRSIGVNRLSLGVQSFDDKQLKKIGRAHSGKEAIDAIETAAKYFDNITIDLMFDLPDQTLEAWKQTLFTLENLPITHLSLYNMTIEPGTAFFKRKHKLRLPSENVSTQMLSDAIDMIPLPRYEISAFAKPGFEAVHNTAYWKSLPFIGFGPSAFSYHSGTRFQNAPDLPTYLAAIKASALPITYHEHLDPAASLRERLAIALRLLPGIDLKAFPPLPLETSQIIAELKAQGLLQDNIALTEKGRLFYDTVASELI